MSGIGPLMHRRHLIRDEPYAGRVSPNDVNTIVRRMLRSELLSDDNTLELFLSLLGEELPQFDGAPMRAEQCELIEHRFAIFEAICDVLPGWQTMHSVVQACFSRQVDLKLRPADGEIFRLMLKFHADIATDNLQNFWRYRNRQGLTPLAVAIQSGHVEACRALSQFGEAQSARQGWPSVMLSLQPSLESLPQYQDTVLRYFGMTALTFAVAIDASPEIIDCFAYSPLHDRRDSRGNTPIHAAVQKGSRIIVQRLIAGGALMTRMDLERLLVSAIKLGHAKILKDLTDKIENMGGQ